MCGWVCYVWVCMCVPSHLLVFLLPLEEDVLQRAFGLLLLLPLTLLLLPPLKHHLQLRPTAHHQTPAPPEETHT